MAYAHIQMMLYRPFLHYVSETVQANNLDKRSYACAAACVSVSRNIIHLTGEMKRRGLLIGSYWFYMYTTFFSIIALVFYVLENPQTPSVEDILKDAHEGKDTLAGLAARSLAADRCSRTLNVWKIFCSCCEHYLRLPVGDFRAASREATKCTELCPKETTSVSTAVCRTFPICA